MRTELILFRTDAHAALAPAGSVPGEAGEGAVVCAIDNCPDEVPGEAVLKLVHNLYPAAGVTRVDYGQLAAHRAGTCCGGACGR
ncbi:MAG TPA: hypothetical protein VEB20_15950 [Azospirillaceae bacterium]|nr:hypothetical protein [Azospirillaceae bacterium]